MRLHSADGSHFTRGISGEHAIAFCLLKCHVLTFHSTKLMHTHSPCNSIIAQLSIQAVAGKKYRSQQVACTLNRCCPQFVGGTIKARLPGTSNNFHRKYLFTTNSTIDSHPKEAIAAVNCDLPYQLGFDAWIFELKWFDCRCHDTAVFKEAEKETRQIDRLISPRSLCLPIRPLTSVKSDATKGRCGAKKRS